MSQGNPAQVLRQLAAGHILPRCLHVVAELGVADALDDRPCTAAALATKVGADADALYRVLRLLAAHGVFEMKGDAFAHSPLSQLLRSDHPRSMRPLVRMMGLPIKWAIYGALDHAVRTGRPSSSQVAPDGFWAYLKQHPQEAEIFDAAMEARSQIQVAAVVAAYDFSAFGVIADIGGGRGQLLRAVLDAVPTANGVLFDLPHVVQGVAPSDRLSLRGGDFFKDELPACDAYLLMDVIHDWGDEETLAILRAIRRAAAVQARLLLIEWVLADDPGPQWTKTIDVHMLALLGGRQRSLVEFGSLLERSGFRLEREIPTAAGISIVEAVCV
jgi:hypothetical protein